MAYPEPSKTRRTKSRAAEGKGIPVQVDHSNAAQVEELFARVRHEQGRLDILACAVWGGNQRFLDPVWEQALLESVPANLG